ncbi:MAG: hypothetical protein ACYS9X_08740 [Planctomycetota bacterium]|jgi:hypothetical protein
MQAPVIISIVAVTISAASLVVAGLAFLDKVLAKRPRLKVTALLRDVMTSEGGYHPDRFIVAVLNTGAVDVHLHGLYALEQPKLLSRLLRREPPLKAIIPEKGRKMRAWPIEIKAGRECHLITDEAESFLKRLHNMGIGADKCLFAVKDTADRRYYSNQLRTARDELIVE